MPSAKAVGVAQALLQEVYNDDIDEAIVNIQDIYDNGENIKKGDPFILEALDYLKQLDNA